MEIVTRPVTTGAKPPRKFFATPGKMCWTWFNTIGHSSKNLGPSQKTLRPSWGPKVVTGLIVTTYFMNQTSTIHSVDTRLIYAVLKLSFPKQYKT